MDSYRLDDEQVDIAVITYNRPGMVEQWLDFCLEKVKDCNYHLSFHDGSTDESTAKILEKKVNSNVDKKIISYIHYDSNIRIDERALEGILRSNCEYVWLIGDSRVLDFSSLVTKIKPYLEQDFDYIAVFKDRVRDKEHKIYLNPSTFFSECFWHCTLLGGLILKKSLFDPLRDEKCKLKYLNKYNRNDGFSYIGIFFELLAERENTKGTLLITSMKDIGVLGVSKKPAWLPRYLEVWCDNMCYLFDQLPAYYDRVKDTTIKDTWQKIALDGYFWLLQARIQGGITINSVKKYDVMGEIDRVSNHKRRIEIVARTPKSIAKIGVELIYLRRKIKKLW